MGYGIPEGVLPRIRPIPLARTDPRMLSRPCQTINEVVPDIGMVHAGPQERGLSMRRMDPAHHKATRYRRSSWMTSAMTSPSLGETRWKSGGGNRHEDANTTQHRQIPKESKSASTGRSSQRWRRGNTFWVKQMNEDHAERHEASSARCCGKAPSVGDGLREADGGERRDQRVGGRCLWRISTRVLPHIVFANQDTSTDTSPSGTSKAKFPEEELFRHGGNQKSHQLAGSTLGCDRGFILAKHEFTCLYFLHARWCGQAVSARPDPPGGIDGLGHTRLLPVPRPRNINPSTMLSLPHRSPLPSSQCPRGKSLSPALLLPLTTSPPSPSSETYTYVSTPHPY